MRPTAGRGGGGGAGMLLASGANHSLLCGAELRTVGCPASLVPSLEKRQEYDSPDLRAKEHLLYPKAPGGMGLLFLLDHLRDQCVPTLVPTEVPGEL